MSGLGSILAVLALLNLAGFRFHLSASEMGQKISLFFLLLASVIPVAGVWVDHRNPRHVMIAADLFRAVLMFALGLLWTPHLVYPIVLVAGGASCFFLVAQTVLLPSLVGREELILANALTAQTQHVNGVIAPTLASLLLAQAGERICFVLNGVSFLISALCLAQLRFDRKDLSERARPSGLRQMGREIPEVFRMLKADRTLLWGVSLAVALVLIAGIGHALGVLYVRDVLHEGPRTFGLLLSSMGMGAMGGFFVIGRYGRTVPRQMILCGSAAIIGVGLIGLTVVQRAHEAVIGAFLIGMAAAAFFVSTQTLVQERMPDHALGRIGGVIWASLFLVQAAALMLAGSLAAWFGLKTLYRGMGVLLLGVAGGLAFSRARREQPR